MTFLSGWGRRKSKIINGSTAGAQTNFQMKLTVHKASGVDTSTDIYLGTNVRDDFGDVRFTNINDTLLDYWIESSTSGVSAVIWVEVDSIPASPSTVDIRIYYSNSSATSLSNGTNTFILFNDFTSDMNGWTSVSSVSISGGKLVSAGSGLVAGYAGDVTLTDYIFEGTRQYFTYYEGLIFRRTSNSAYYLIWTDNWDGTKNLWLNLSRFNPGRIDISNNIFTTFRNTDYKFKIVVAGSNIKYYNITGTENLIINNNDSTFPSGNIGFGRIVVGDYSGNLDDTRIRKYATPEPTFGATEASAVVNVTSTAADGTYTTGQVIPITVQFEDNVTVTGTPQLQLETGSTDRQAPYSSGTGTTTITLNYTVQAGDTSSDLDYVATNSLTLNGGTIVDINSLSATLTLPSPGAAGSLGANKAIVISGAVTTTPTLGNLYSSIQRGISFVSGIGASLGRRKQRSR